MFGPNPGILFVIKVIFSFLSLVADSLLDQMLIHEKSLRPNVGIRFQWSDEVFFFEINVSKRQSYHNENSWNEHFKQSFLDVTDVEQKFTLENGNELLPHDVRFKAFSTVLVDFSVLVLSDCHFTVRRFLHFHCLFFPHFQEHFFKRGNTHPVIFNPKLPFNLRRIKLVEKLRET